MRHMRDYFQDGLCHVQEQMSELRWLLQAVDPPLCRHLGAVGAGGCEFAFQMLMVAFRREIPWKVRLDWRGEK